MLANACEAHCRGCMTVMEQGGYAANGVKHCVRPADMTGHYLCLHACILRQVANLVAWQISALQTMLGSCLPADM